MSQFTKTITQNKLTAITKKGESVQIEGAFSVANANPMPLDFFKATSEIPSDLKVSVKTPVVQLTSHSVAKAIKRNAIIAQHWLNTPLQDGLLSVSRIYKTISDAAFNYQREHTDSFFEQYPELIIVPDDEDKSSLTTAVLRRNYRTYAKRIAHYFYQYIEARKMLAAALYDLMILGKLNGNEVTKEIAYNVRWSVVNTRCNLYSRFPVQTGLDAYMCEYSKYAVGKTSFGADIVSFPLWIADILGNRATALNALTNTYSVGQSHLSGTELGLHKDPTADARSFLNHEACALLSYVFDVPYTSMPYNAPHMPRVENGSVRVFTDGNTSTQYMVDNQPADNLEYATFGGVTDGLTSAIWNCYKFWETYLIDNFSDMMDPNNDKYIMATEQLKICVKSLELSDINKIVRNNNNISITSLAKHMFYKSNNEVNTATIVKWMPLIFGGEEGSESAYINTDYWNAFTANFERYDVEASNAAATIAESDLYPKLTPYLECKVEESGTTDTGYYQPMVLNTVPMIGQDLLSEEDMATQYDGVQSPVGKVATMLDYASSSNIDQESSRVDAIGIDSDSFKSFISNPDAIVFEEMQEDVRVFTQPLIDNTDLAQCGFNLLISYSDPNPNEWVKYFTTTSNYVDLYNGVDINRDVSVIAAGEKDGFTNTSPYYYNLPCISYTNSSSGDEYRIRHVACSDFMSVIQHALVFIGGAIFGHPWQTCVPKHAGFYVNDISLTEGGELAMFLLQEIAMLEPSQGNTMTRAELLQGQSDIEPGYMANFLSNSGTKQTLCSMVNIASALETISEGDTVYIEEYYFNPSYGAVAPLAVQMPYADCGSLIPYPAVSELVLSTTSEIVPFIGLSAPIMFNEGANGFNNSYNSRYLARYTSTDSSRLNPVLFLLYFLESIQFKKVTVSDSGVQVIYDNAIYPIKFGAPAKSFLTLTSRLMSMYNGIQNTIPFWSKNIDLGIKMAMDGNFDSTSDFPENNILMEPRIVQAKTNGKGSSLNYRDHGQASLAPQQGVSVKENKPEKSKSGSGNKQKFRNYRRKNGKSKSYQTEEKSSDVVSISADAADPSQLKTINSLTNDDIDKSYAAKRKKRQSSKSVSDSMQSL